MKNYLLTILLISPLWIFAQRGDVHNEGTLYVSPGTLVTAEANFNNKPTGKYTNDGEVLFRGHFNNDGLTSFTQALDGYTRFQGFHIQEISGSIDSDFKHVLFDNPHADYSFLLSGGMYVFGETNFYQGVVDNYNYGGRMIFEQDAHHINTSDRSYVEGEVQKFGDNSFIFPVGKESMYRPGGIIQLGEMPTAFPGEYHAYNSNIHYPHQQHAVEILEIDDKEYWTIEEHTDFGQVLITLSWDERITPHNLLDDYEALVVLTWDKIEEKWISLGGVANPNERIVTSIVEGQTYDVFTLGTIRVIPEDDDFIIYNGVYPQSPTGNDYFKIVGLDNFPENRVRIYNRWGVLVFDEQRYDTNNNVFRGISEGRTTIKRGDELPVGTYFYILDYVVPETGQNKSIQGYLYLNR